MLTRLETGLSETYVEDADVDSESMAESFHSLDPRWIYLEQIGGLIFTAVVAVGSLVALTILWTNLGFGWIWYLVAASAALVVLVFLYFAIFWPYKTYQCAKWRLDDEGLEIRRGVIWRHRISVPLGRVQHADVSQGPLQRQFDIGKLTVHTAGTQNASVELDGLTHAVALEIRDRLVKQREAGNVV